MKGCCEFRSFEEGHLVEDMAEVLRQKSGDDLLETFACDVVIPAMQVTCIAIMSLV